MVSLLLLVIISTRHCWENLQAHDCRSAGGLFRYQEYSCKQLASTVSELVILNLYTQLIL